MSLKPSIVSASIFVFYVARSTEYRVEATILKPKQPPPPKVRKPVIEEESESSERIEESTEVYSALSEIASSVGAISRSRPLYEGTPIPGLLVLRKSY